MSNTTRTLWALAAYASSALLAFACSSDTVGTEGQGLDPATNTSAGTTTGGSGDAGSSVGGAQSATSSTATTGQTQTELSTSGSTDSGATTSSVTSGTTGGEPVTTTGETSTSATSAAGGTSGVTTGLSSTSDAGGASGTTDTTTTDAGSTAAGGTSTVIDDPECEEFCDLFFEACADEVADSFYSDQLYPDHASCMAVCVTFEKGGNYGSDTLGCRRAHIVDNPDGGFHCTHASESGGGQCPPEQ